MSFKRLENLLNTGAGDGLNKLVQHAQQMDALTGALRAVLPGETARNLVAANLREDGELVLICASPAWASRMRFESKNLVCAARRAGFAAQSMRVSVSRETT